MHANRRLVEADHRADFARRAVPVMAEHEHGALASFEAVDGGGHAGAAFPRQETRCRVARAGACRAGGKGGAVVRGGQLTAGLVDRYDPSVAADAGFTSIEAPV